MRGWRRWIWRPLGRLLRLDDLQLSRLELTTLVALGALFAFATLAGLGAIAGYRTLAGLFSRADWPWFPVALGGEIGAHLGYAIAYREIARLGGGRRLSLSRLLGIVVSGFGVFILHGGFVADYEVLVDAGLPRREARLRVLGLGALEYAVLAPAAWIAAVFLLLRGSRVHPSFTVPWAVAVPAALLLALTLATGQRRWHARSGWRRRVSDALDAASILKRVVRQPRRRPAAAVAGMTLYWAGDVFCLWACLNAFLSRPPVAALIVGYATGYTLTRRTLPLAGTAVVEASLPFALFWVNIRFAPALLAVVAYRALGLWLPLIPALVGYSRLQHLHALPAVRADRPDARPPDAS